MVDHNAFDDDDDKKGGEGGSATRFKEFECPDCNAHNPVDEPIGSEDEVRCNYCGTEFRVVVTDSGRLKLKEL